MAISMERAKTLCSASELALVKASTRQEIGSHTAARLRQKEARARKLRDKWRDLSKGQQRSSQSKGRASGPNKNSAAKAALFGEVLGRYTAQLAKLQAAGETPGPMGRRRSTKKARSRTHRAARSEARAELAGAKLEIKSKAKKKAAPPTAKPPAKRRKAQPIAAAAALPVDEVAERSALSVSPAAEPKQKSKRQRPAHATAIEAGQQAQGLRVTKQSQLAARTAAKQSRLKASGLLRIQKSRSAANKRNQGRRDSR